MRVLPRLGEAGGHVRRRIDAHHHLWELGRFPYAWLAPDSPPRPFGDHTALKRDYRLADYRKDVEGANVVGSVFVEANAGANGAEEIRWVDAVAGDGAWPRASVGSLDLRRADADAVLADMQQSPRMRGIRMSLCWDRERPQWRFIDAADVMQSPAFLAGLSALTRRSLIFDVLVVPHQLRHLAMLAREHPEQVFVLNHLGTPWFETAADREHWHRGMRDCAACANITVKISGLWPLDRGWRPAVIRDPVRYVIDLFGPARCMWASNLPVEKVMCPVRDQVANLEEVLHDLAEVERDRIFFETATRVYRLDPERAENEQSGR